MAYGDEFAVKAFAELAASGDVHHLSPLGSVLFNATTFALETAANGKSLSQLSLAEGTALVANLVSTARPILDGILDSIATVKLVSFLEEKYGIELEAHELSPDYLNTLSDIAVLVTSRLPRD